MATDNKKQQTESKAQSRNQRNVTQSMPPHRIYYSFADALKIVRYKVPNCTADYLLYCGLMGKVKFFIHVPHGLNVYTVCEIGFESNNLSTPPRLLVIDKMDCGAIEWNKKIIIGLFPSGYWFNGVSFQETYPRFDQPWASQEIKFGIFENVSHESIRKNLSDLRLENKAQSDKWMKTIFDPNSRNGILPRVHISNAPDLNATTDIQNAQATSFVKDVTLAISEKTLFVTHDELIRLIKTEVISLPLSETLAVETAKKELQEESLYQRTLKAGQSTPGAFEIRERSTYYLSPTIYFTLEEAVEAVKQQHPECTASQLLEFGFSNKLRFITPVPIGIDLVGVRPDNSDAVSCSVPQFLIVESAECETILRKGKVSIGRFKRGHGYALGSFDIFPDNHLCGRNNILFQWATLYQGQPHKIEITVDRLFLVQSDLANLVLSESGSWKTIGEERPDIHESLLNRPHDKAGPTEVQQTSSSLNSIADSPGRRPSMLSEREVIKRLGLSRTTINAYQNKKYENYYDPTFPKKRKVAENKRSIAYLESEVTHWANQHIRPK